MDINEAKSFLIVMGFLCFITASISFYNFTKNKQFLRLQTNQINDDYYYQKEIKQINDDYYYQKEIKQINDDYIN
jgi:hypothetical protein